MIYNIEEHKTKCRSHKTKQNKNQILLQLCLNTFVGENMRKLKKNF
jgi:hypothetical protein